MLPKPTTFVDRFRDDDLMFNQFPNSLYKAQLAVNPDPTACVVVHGETVTATTVESQVARICPAPSWKWEALPHGDNAFLLGFQSLEDL